MKTAPKAKAKLFHFRVIDPAGVVWKGVGVPPGELISTPMPGRHIARWLQKRRVRKEADPKTGICKKCGCTWTRACAGGCSWANAKRTVCSNCSAFK
jgi:hypothetical protein